MVLCQALYGPPRMVRPEHIHFRPAVYALIPWKHSFVFITLASTGKYGLPGGAVEPYEPLEDALRREVHEETGLTVTVERLLHFKETFWYYNPTEMAYHGLSFFYHCAPLTTQLWRDDQVRDGRYPEATCPRWINPQTLQSDDIQAFGDVVMAFYPTLIEKHPDEA